MRRLPYLTAAALAATLVACGGDDDPTPTPAATDTSTAAASSDLPPRLDALAQDLDERGHDVRPVDTTRAAGLDRPRPEDVVRIEFPARDLTVRAYRSARVVEAAFDDVRKELHGSAPPGVIHLLVREHVSEVVGCGRYLYFGPDAAIASNALQEALRAADLCRGQLSNVGD